MSGSVILFFFLGLALVIGGAEAVVRGAARLATTLGVPPLIIGLTVVAFGTSAPELVVNLQAATTGNGDIALGNVIGSNIFNILFVLGLSALIAPLRVSEQLIRLDLPVMMGAASLMMLLAFNGRVGHVDGIVLLLFLFTYLGLLLALARRRPELVPVHAEIVVPPGKSRWYTDTLLIVAGLIGLVLGSRWFVGGAVAFSRMLGLSEFVIGLTMVAGGTSLPEVATAVAASLRGQRDLAVGNVVGSNIFNVLLVIGATAVIAPGGMPVPPAALRLDLPLMAFVSIACLPIFIAGMRISRLEGGIFLGYYAAYIVFLFLNATSPAATSTFEDWLFIVIAPLTILLIAILLVRPRMPGEAGGPPGRP